MSTRIDSRQSRQRSILDELSPNTNLRLDVLLNLINDELTPSLRLKDNGGSDRVLNIGAIIVQTLDGAEGTGRKHTIPPIGTQYILPQFNGGSITFPSASGGSITASGITLDSSYTLTVSSGQWIKVLLGIKTNGNIVLAFGTEGATEAAATLPVAIVNAYNIGFVSIHNTGGTIDNISNPYIYQFSGGGGSGGGGGSSLYVAQNAHGFTVGQPIRATGSGWSSASSSDRTTLAHGVVTLVPDANSFIVSFSGEISGLSGLTAGSTYYLQSGGTVGTTQPYSNGEWIQPVYVAITTTSALILPMLNEPDQEQVSLGVRSDDNSILSSGDTLIVPSGKSLVHPNITIPSGVTYQIDGCLVASGGVYGTGTITGTGKVIS